MNTLKFSLATGALSLMASSAVALDCTGAANSSSDYCLAIASQETWTEDSSNDFIRSANSFACVIANSAPGTNANRTYLALISEEACGLSDPEDEQSSGTVYTPGYTVSSWAGAGLTQEIVSYFDSKLSGNQYIANVNLRATADTLPPFGSWYFSYFQAGSLNDAETAYDYVTPDNSESIGYVDIAASGDDVVITSADRMLFEDNFCGEGSVSEMGSKTKYISGSADNTIFIGKLRNNCVGQQDQTAFAAGQTTATLYYKLNLAEDGSVLGSQCLDRNAEWEVAHDLKIYEATTGVEKKLSGGFGFKLSDGNARGYIGNWGAWIESPDIKFSPSSNSLDITAESGSATKLIWSPGRLRTQTPQTNELADGDIFHTYIDAHDKNYYITWDATNKNFVYQNGGSSATYMPTYEKWMWSTSKRASVVYTPSKSGAPNTTIEVMVESDKTFNPNLASVTSTTFKGRGSGTHGDPNDLPYTYADWSARGQELSKDDGNTRKTYHYTGAAPGGTFEPYTLYLDDGNGTLSANDAPVRFDFAVNEKKTKYLNFKTNQTASYSKPNSWPEGWLDLILESEDGNTASCDLASNEVSGCTRYFWRFGAFPWDNKTAALDADSTLVPIEEPIQLSLTFDKTKDRNNGQLMTFSTKNLDNASLPGCVSKTNGNGDAYKECANVDVRVLQGEKFTLEFDGGQVHGRPGLHVCNSSDCSTDSSYWTFAVNPVDGTTVTDINGKEYLLASRGVSKSYASATTGACDTAGISFTALTDSNFALSVTDIPVISTSSTDYPLPSQSWSDKPADTAVECTVTMGDTTNCDALTEG